MLSSIWVKLGAIGAFIIAIFTAGYVGGKNTIKNKQRKESIEDAIDTKKRNEDRRNQSINDIRAGMQKYTRK